MTQLIVVKVEKEDADKNEISLIIKKWELVLSLYSQSVSLWIQ